MPILINIDMLLAKHKFRSKELADAVGITESNLSILKTGKGRAIRFSTLVALCRFFNCQPGDILEFKDENK